MQDRSKALSVLTLNTVAFTACFAAWMLNGVLITFLMDNHVYDWTESQVGWLIGIPVLTGAVMRLPAGVLTDRFGGRVIFPLLMLCSAIPMFLLSYADSYLTFMAASLGFGLAGASFAVGVGYTSLWFPKERQGTALGIFGAGNLGAALTSMFAPSLLTWLTADGENIEGWRRLPQMYAGLLVVITILFLLFTHSRKVEGTGAGLMSRLAPLRHMRVWRFGFYYFLTFGGFVALAQWLIPYYVNAYTMSVATAGFMAALFSLPSGLVRALGGVLADKFGPRRVMYVVFSTCLVCFALLMVPRMDIASPGKGIMAKAAGTVTAVSDDAITVGATQYPLKTLGTVITEEQKASQALVLPKSSSQQIPVVSVGEVVGKKQLIARGVTHIHFQANIWVFTFLVFVAGFMMGIGNAAIYKHIPDYFPQNVGVVGGIVGVLGGLGGFVCPIFFGYLLEYTGIWTTSWMLFTLLAAVCLAWMHFVITHMHNTHAPSLATRIEHPEPDAGQTHLKPSR